MTAKRKAKLPEGIRKVGSGRYQARYPVTVNGVTTQKSAGTFAKLIDAKDARSLAIAQLRTGTWLDPAGPRMTFEAWATRYFELRGGKIENRHRSFLRVHLIPTFGSRRIGEITPMDVQAFVNGLGHLAPITGRAIYGLLRQMMDLAVEYDLLPKTPCRRIVLPKAQRSKPTPLSVKQLLDLEMRAPDRYRAMIHLSSWTGMRWQECAALRWENVHLTGANPHILICEAVKSDSQVIGTTKNGRERVVPLGQRTVEVLTAHRRDFGQHDLVFTGRRIPGRRVNYGSFRKYVWDVLVEGMSPKPTFHDLRHGFAAHMVSGGIDPKVLSDALGHYSAGFTMQTYGWARQDAGSVLAAAVDGAMSGE